MKKTILNSLAIASIIASGTVFAENNTTDFQASAKVENFCVIEADDVNFGQVSLPLTQQGTNSKMRVHCSNGAPYTIDLAYGGVYGQGTQGVDTITTKYSYTGSSGSIYVLNSEQEGSLGTVYCQSINREKYIQFSQEKAAEKFGYVGVTSQPDVNNFCSLGLAPPATISQGYKVYDYGIMTGSSKGDSLAYQITVPGDISKVWNSGNGNYVATGNGSIQEIDVNAKILPNNSTSLYLAQDSYLDTVTAIISY